MAYTTVFAKESVEKINDNDFRLSVSVVVSDDSGIVKEKTYSVRYNKSWSIDKLTAKLQKKMKDDWDKYAAEQTILCKPAFDTLVANIKTDYDSYINS